MLRENRDLPALQTVESRDFVRCKACIIKKPLVPHPAAGIPLPHACQACRPGTCLTQEVQSARVVQVHGLAHVDQPQLALTRTAHLGLARWRHKQVPVPGITRTAVHCQAGIAPRSRCLQGAYQEWAPFSQHDYRPLQTILQEGLPKQASTTGQHPVRTLEGGHAWWTTLPLLDSSLLSPAR